ncbi:hypothetical protein EZI54_18295 [Marinobacter halodurans]|uniref:Cupin-like domain-containing protein n=1 Tax=Marinobacter halodurans TaxID=2528979 RepID=A0ABY1ZGE8_9GAMM|nr:cupin-like domain-containing protein [Marinobacter halodurans]TBW50334.1 hypothetical protein EZI54_18295 [Marinobacter halodurans]
MTNKIVRVIDLVPGKVETVRSIDANSLNAQQFWTEFVLTHTPVIIKGAISDWPAVEKWKMAGYLESRVDDEKVNMSRTFNALPMDIYYDTALYEQRLADCLRELYSADDDMTLSIPATQIPEQWEEDIGDYSFISKAFEERPLFYVGKRVFIYKNASTDWHFHPTDETITSQIVGSKKVSLFRLNKGDWRGFSRPISSNLHHMSCGREFFPKDRQITKYEGIIEAGDSIYIPPFWWHGIDPVNAEPGVTYAHCFRTPITRFGDWNEPIIKGAIKTVMLQAPMVLIPLLARVAYSTYRRKKANEKWWPI